MAQPDGAARHCLGGHDGRPGIDGVDKHAGGDFVPNLNPPLRLAAFIVAGAQDLRGAPSFWVREVDRA